MRISPWWPHLQWHMDKIGEVLVFLSLSSCGLEVDCTVSAADASGASSCSLIISSNIKPLVAGCSFLTLLRTRAPSCRLVVWHHPATSTSAQPGLELLNGLQAGSPKQKQMQALTEGELVKWRVAAAACTFLFLPQPLPAYVLFSSLAPQAPLHLPHPWRRKQQHTTSFTLGASFRLVPDKSAWASFR